MVGVAAARRFRCCSFAAAAAAISLSSIADAADAFAVAADRSTAAVVAPEFRIQNMKIMTNRSIGSSSRSIDHSTATPAATAQRKE